ncbi:MAG: hypothetical protein Wins2KO_22510 [Winogradskyella sp.]
MKKSISLVLYLIAVLTVFNCSEEDNNDTSAPEVSFVSPTLNSIFELGNISEDGISIELDIVDNVRIGSLSIEIKDANENTVYTFVDTQVFSSDLDNYHLIENFKPEASGNYFIQCFVSDTSFNNVESDIVEIVVE